MPMRAEVLVLVFVGVAEDITLLLAAVGQVNGCLKVTISGLMRTMMVDEETGSTATVMEAHAVVVIVLLMVYGLEDISLDSLILCHPCDCNPVVKARRRASASSARD